LKVAIGSSSDDDASLPGLDRGTHAQYRLVEIPDGMVGIARGVFDPIPANPSSIAAFTVAATSSGVSPYPSSKSPLTGSPVRRASMPA
jgi:hypothetical protein